VPLRRVVQMSNGTGAHSGQLALLAWGSVTQPDEIGRATITGALLVTTLGLAGSVATVASAAVPDEAVSQALAAAPVDESAESAESAEEAEEAAEEAEEATEEAAASAYASSAKPLPKDVVRKIKRLTREIEHVKSVRRKLHAKIVELKQLPSTSKRRGPALARTRAKHKKKRLHLRNLRRERRALAHS